jgi:uncharacterized membrane protein
LSYSDSKLQRLIGVTLRTGVLSASALGLLGGVLFFASRPQAADFRVFQGASMPFSDPAQILRQAFAPPGELLSLRGLSIIQLGILVLLATPVIRVVFSVVGFALERDRTFVMITLLVLVVLAISISLH